MERSMTDAERDEARRIIRVQASTMPRVKGQGDEPLAPLPREARLAGQLIDLGPVGAWERAYGVRTGAAGDLSLRLEDVSLSAATSGMGERAPRRGGRFV